MDVMKAIEAFNALPIMKIVAWLFTMGVVMHILQKTSAALWDAVVGWLKRIRKSLKADELKEVAEALPIVCRSPQDCDRRTTAAVTTALAPYQGEIKALGHQFGEEMKLLREGMATKKDVGEVKESVGTLHRRLDQHLENDRQRATAVAEGVTP